MTTDNIEAEPEQKQDGVLSRIFNKVTALVQGLNKELRGNIEEAHTEQQKELGNTASWQEESIDRAAQFRFGNIEAWRLDSIDRTVQFVLSNSENLTAECIEKNTNEILQLHHKLKTGFFDNGNITAEEIIQKVEEKLEQTTPQNDHTLTI